MIKFRFLKEIHEGECVYSDRKAMEIGDEKNEEQELKEEVPAEPADPNRKEPFSDHDYHLLLHRRRHEPNQKVNRKRNHEPNQHKTLKPLERKKKRRRA